MVGASREDAPIAITGLACRLPGEGNNLSSFWSSICRGTSAWSEIPKERFSEDAFPGDIPLGGHFIKDDISLFDANFFRISHNEARAMDPQQRLMLEVVYEALEAGGYARETVAGTSTGVYMGQFTSDYKELISKDSEAALSFSVTGLQSTSLSNRISWLLDLKGPSLTMDTACSSSLVALHLACQSLRTGESQMAIVGGCNLMISPDMFMFEKGQGFLSPDGKCKTFDQSANGYGRGEGLAVVVLKRIDIAVADGDPIRAVIRGSATNQDGHTKGFTLPSSEAQASLIRRVYRQAGLDLDGTSYVEAHGTGTKAGDLEETLALSGTLAAARTNGDKLLVGSVKSNIGHLEAAAGLASVMKCVMMLEAGMIPPNIHLKNPNPNIKFEDWNLKVPTELMPWPPVGRRRISINSFGYGGSNAHIILDDAESYLKEHQFTDAKKQHLQQYSRPILDQSGSTRHRVFLFSAQDKEGINRVKKSLSLFLEQKARKLPTVQESDEYLDNIAFTVSERRSRLQWKTFVIASSLVELASALRAEENASPAYLSSNNPSLAFIFTGQGAQWAGMGMELIKYDAFKDSINAADEYLKTLGCGWSAFEELSRGKSSSKLRMALYSQTLCTVLQVALVDLLRDWGISPTSVVGHSSGEIGAAYCFGALSRQDAWKVAYFRGVMSSRLKDSGLHGAMLAVGSSPEIASQLIAELSINDVHIACINSPKSVTLSGDAGAIDMAYLAFQEKGMFARKLQVDTAYHSPHMLEVAQEYFAAIIDISPQPPREGCSMYSSVTGEIVHFTDIGPVYWVRNLMSTVRFAAAIQQLMKNEQKPDILVEVGPHSALNGPSTQSLQDIGITNIPYHSILVRYQSGIETALNLAGTLSAQGYSVSFPKVNQVTQMRRPLTDLPSYPWNHSQSHWAEPRVSMQYRLRSSAYNSLLGGEIPSFMSGERTWRCRIRLSERPWIADHKIQGTVFYPAAGFLASAIEAMLATAEPGRKIANFNLRDVNLKAALAIEEEDDIEYLVNLRPNTTSAQNSSPWSRFTITSCQDGKTLQENCHGIINIEYESVMDNQTTDGSTSKYQEAMEICQTKVRTDPFYKLLEKIGFQYGPSFRNLKKIHIGRNQSFGIIEIPVVEAGESRRSHVIHPTTMDAIFHLVFAALKGTPEGVTQAMVPKAFNEIVLSANISSQAGSKMSGFSRAFRQGFTEIMADINVKDEITDNEVLKISGLCLQEVGGGNSTSTAARSVCSSVVWRPKLEIIKPQEQKGVLERAIRRQLGTNSCDSAALVTVALSELISHLHHCNPSISILEVFNCSNAAKPLLAEAKCLQDVTKTGSLRIVCQDESSKEAAEKQLVAYDDILVELDDPIDSSTHDEAALQSSHLVILRADVSDLNILAKLIRSYSQTLAVEGRLCLVVPTGNFVAIERMGMEAGLSNWFTIDGLGGLDSQKLSLVVGWNNAQQNSGPNETKEVKKVIILEAPDSSPGTSPLSRQLKAKLTSLGYAASFQSWGTHGQSWDADMCISLVELDSPMFENIVEQDFNQFKALVLNTKKVLWLSGHGGPSSAIVTGLARVIRNEEPGLAFHTLQFDLSKIESASKLASLITQTINDDSGDNEYLIEDNFINVGRILEDDAMNKSLRLLNPQTRETPGTIRVSEATDPLALSIRNAGNLDSLYYKRDQIAEASIDENDVEIMVKAASLNSRDVNTALGRLPDTDLGFSAAGIVSCIGSAVTRFNVGDRVVMCGPGAQRTMLRGDAQLCEPISDEMTFEEASTVPLSYGLAWYSLVHLAQSQRGQTILVHDAAVGVGLAAVQIAQHAGLNIFATVGSSTERALLRDTCGVQDGHIFSYKDTSFVDGIKIMTNNRGVDIVINTQPGEILASTWDCLVPFGILVHTGNEEANKDPDVNRRLPRDVTSLTANIDGIVKKRPDLIARILREVLKLLRSGINRSIYPSVSFPASDIKEAFHFVERGQHPGQVAITYSREDIVPHLQIHDLPLGLDPEAAYVLAGGLGGLGRCISRMLVENGARRLCFLSRSGPNSVMAEDLTRELESLGAEVIVQSCDISDPDAVDAAINVCSEKLGHIRGVIQCAMVLRDTLFSNMSHREWIESTRPKVQGTWNLHQKLPEVDFFISLGSFTSIFGNRGQSNYAAGSAYQDAVAHFRRSQGQHAVTIDVGVVRDVGTLAENGMSNTLRDFEGPYGLDEYELLNLIKLAIEGDVSGRIAPQIVTGLATGGSAAKAGIDAWYLSDSKFSIMAKVGSKQGVGAADHGASFQKRLSTAASQAEAAGIVMEALVGRVAKMLQTDAGEIDTDRFLYSYGIDSLVAIQIVDFVLRELKAQITVLDVMAAVPITETVRRIARKSTLVPKQS